MKVKEWPLEIVYKCQEWRHTHKDYYIRQKYGNETYRSKGEIGLNDGPNHLLWQNTLEKVYILWLQNASYLEVVIP